MMKSAVVIGATTQVGFALCQYLITKEVEVTGLVWSEKMDEKSEQMLMEIGRNAFFNFQRDRSFNQSLDAVFYCLDGVNHLDVNEQGMYLELAEKGEKLVFISSYRKMPLNQEYKQHLLKKVKDKREESCYSIYLPMVYGPWQQEEEAVYKRLIEELEQKEPAPLAIKEQDVLFVEDVAEAIYHYITRDEKKKEVLFENENPQASEELKRELNLTLLASIEPKEVEKLTRYKVPQRHTIKEGIQAQRDQMYQKLKID
ncbi:hypothetical protein [Sutcliffiella horikoshii]|uniref:hypothetical protein n=1 Tax=Sutcliffiella horikoshii TaxID=79883 RepID=UPI001CFF1397|nr:hypothetical protein [Sutcliffiella horikoshii]